MSHPNAVEASGGDTLDLGPIKLRRLVGAAQTSGAFAMGEFSGQLEAMFVELSQLPPGSVGDPEVRKAISARHDSIPS